VLATLLFLLTVAAILLVLWQQRRAERLASVRLEQEETEALRPAAAEA
jgi:hypothetical protein